MICAQHIIEATALHYDIERSDIIGPRRFRRFAWPRQLAMTMIWDLTNLSYPATGYLFGDRDHTTVMHAVKVFKARKAWTGEHQDYKAIERVARELSGAVTFKSRRAEISETPFTTTRKDAA